MKARTIVIFAMIFLFLGMVIVSGALAQPAKKTAKGYSASTVKFMSKRGVGRYLADAKGMSLYYFKKDSTNKSVCTAAGDCLTKWPIFYAEKIVVPKRLKAKYFGEITREDGKKQTTYKGWPLYYFFKDAKPGDMLGEGVNNVWYVIYPAKFKP